MNKFFIVHYFRHENPLIVKTLFNSLVEAVDRGKIQSDEFTHFRTFDYFDVYEIGDDQLIGRVMLKRERATTEESFSDWDIKYIGGLEVGNWDGNWDGN